MANDLLRELGLDPDDPQVAAAIADAELAASVANALISRRRESGLTPRDIEKRIGWHYGKADDFERLGRDPTVSALQQYARALGMRLELAIAIEGDRP